MQRKGKRKHKEGKGMFHNKMEELQKCPFIRGMRDCEEV